MKKNTHPQYNDDATVVCLCGNTFKIGSVKEHIETELCHKCHPFYTGEQRIVDTDDRVSKYKQRQKVASKKSFTSKREKMARRKKMKAQITGTAGSSTPTLKDMLAQIKAS